MNTGKVFFYRLVFFLILGVPALVNAAQPKVLKLAHNLHQSHPVHLAFVYMNEQLQKISANSMQLRIYPSSQMGSPTDALQLLQMGALDLAKGNGSDLEAFESSYALFNLPFLFRDERHFDAVVQGDVGKSIMNKTREHGFFGIASYVAGYRSFYARKPISKPDDLKGMKVRVQVSPMNLEMIRLMGGSATAMAFGEVYTALQQGVVDAAENNEVSWVDTRHIEVAPVFSETRHISLPDFLIISTSTWNHLNKQQQSWLMEAASRSESYQREQWGQATTVARNKAVKSGAQIIAVDREPFRNSVKPLYEKFRMNPEHAELLNKAIQAGEP